MSLGGFPFIAICDHLPTIRICGPRNMIGQTQHEGGSEVTQLSAGEQSFCKTNMVFLVVSIMSNFFEYISHARGFNGGPFIWRQWHQNQARIKGERKSEHSFLEGKFWIKWQLWRCPNFTSNVKIQNKQWTNFRRLSSTTGGILALLLFFYTKFFEFMARARSPVIFKNEVTSILILSIHQS